MHLSYIHHVCFHESAESLMRGVAHVYTHVRTRCTQLRSLRVTTMYTHNIYNIYRIHMHLHVAAACVCACAAVSSNTFLGIMFYKYAQTWDDLWFGEWWPNDGLWKAINHFHNYSFCRCKYIQTNQYVDHATKHEHGKTYTTMVAHF